MEEAVLKARADNADRQVQREQMAVDVQMKREEIASRERIAAASREASIQQAQAASIGKQFEKNDKAAETAK
ncbi:hypothetical protein D3C87_2071380 [compost metagenome]